MHDVPEEITGTHNVSPRLTTLTTEVRGIDIRLSRVEDDVSGIAKAMDWQNNTLRDQSRVLSELAAGAIKKETTRATTEMEETAAVRKQRRERITQLITLIVATIVAAYEIATRLGGCS